MLNICRRRRSKIVSQRTGDGFCSENRENSAFAQCVDTQLFAEYGTSALP